MCGFPTPAEREFESKFVYPHQGIMFLKQEMDLTKLKTLGPVPVHLAGEIVRAPYSQRPCVRFEWLHSSKSILDEGFTRGHGTGAKSLIAITSSIGDFTIYPDGIKLYIAPSFDGKAMVDGKERNVMEFCLEPSRTYYVFSEKFTYYLPPFRFFLSFQYQKPNGFRL